MNLLHLLLLLVLGLLALLLVAGAAGIFIAEAGAAGIFIAIASAARIFVAFGLGQLNGLRRRQIQQRSIPRYCRAQRVGRQRQGNETGRSKERIANARLHIGTSWVGGLKVLRHARSVFR